MMAEKKKLKVEDRKSKQGEANIDVSSPTYQTFSVYQKELDTKHDKHERLVKISRDITIDSKRTIFLLQRVAGSDDPVKVLEEAWEKIKQIQQKKFCIIATELQNEDPYQFMRAYSPGLQEYIEAVSFYHYLKSKTLVPLSDIQKDLVFPNTDSQTKEASEVCVPPIEYMMGVADLTGELMRLAINSVGAGNLDIPFQVCEFLRTMQSGFESVGYASRELKRKLHTLQQSLQKVETACYTLQVRGSEIPKHMLVDVLSRSHGDIPMYSEDPVQPDD